MVGAFDKALHEVSICADHRAGIYFILQKSIYLHFVHHGNKFYDRYIKAYFRSK